MSEKVAVIASILKPVNDTRMYEKLGRSIRESNKYRVNIIGFGVKNIPVQQGMAFHTLYQGKRSGVARLLAPLKFLIKLIQLHPNLTIVCTPELLLPAVLYKLIYSTRLWYDVQENYQRNVTFQEAYPAILKPLLRFCLWLVENTTRPFIDVYLLAERCYAQELPFVKGKHVVLENKFISPDINLKPRENDKIQMIFTGTCSRENGIVEAISMVTSLYQHGCPVKLTIAGQVPNPEMHAFIKTLTEGTEFIDLVGDGSLVSHSTIMELASNANFGLVAHQPNPSNENCIPTKLYEYLGLQLPMILQKHSLWESIVDPYQAAIVIDFNDFNPEKLWHQLTHNNFYSKNPGKEISWKQEALKLYKELEMMSDS
jgi:hypothetical protein